MPKYENLVDLPALTRFKENSDVRYATRHELSLAVSELMQYIDDAIAELTPVSPTGFTHLQYIISNSRNTYINTGLTLDGGLSFVVEGCTEANGAGIMFDCYGSSSQRMGGIFYNRQSPRYDRWWAGVNYVQQSTSGIDLSSKFHLTQDAYGCTITQDGVTSDASYSGDVSMTNPNVPVLLFSSQRTDLTPSFSLMYSCKISKNGVLLRDFIPCKRNEDDVVGMLDKVNDVFYMNAGDYGSFTPGPAVQ